MRHGCSVWPVAETAAPHGGWLLAGHGVRCVPGGLTPALYGGTAGLDGMVRVTVRDERSSSPNAYPAMTALLAAGAVRTEPLTTHVYPLAGVATAFGALARREAIRPVLTP